MKVLVLSDPHANWHALKAVLEETRNSCDEIVCCGDLVGYNAEPGMVLDWFAGNVKTIVRGNHDKVVAGLEDLNWFNDVAQTAAKWSIEQLERKQIQYLAALPKGPVEHGGFHLWHGSPNDEDEYVTSVFEASSCFPKFDLPLAFFGHTHLQGGFFLTAGRIGTIAPVRADRDERVLDLDPDVTYLFNPGSVGQPRDGDPRAAYAVYDSEQRTVTLRRVAYDIEKEAENIRRAGLPEALAARLFYGA